MTYKVESLIRLYRKIVLTLDNTEIDKKQFDVMITFLHTSYGEVIKENDLIAFSLYLEEKFPILGLVTSELLRSYNDTQSVELTDREIEIYVVLSKNLKKYEQRFNIT